MPDADAQLVAASWDLRRMRSARPATLGGKAMGLLEVPEDWTPSFLLLGPGFVARWAGAGTARSLFDAAPSAQEQLVALFAQGNDASWCDGIMVRSNAPSERSQDRRGAYVSVKAASTYDAVTEAIDAVLAQGEAADEPVYALVQLAVRRIRGGHLSNERRVTSRRTVWLREDLDEQGYRLSTPTLIDSRVPGEDLSAATESVIDAALRRVANRLTEPGERRHCEWVWDGHRIWVVQQDVVSSVASPGLRSYLKRRAPGGAPEIRPDELRCMLGLSPERAADWSKFGRRLALDALGMPTATVLLLDGATFVDDRARDHRLVRADLHELLRVGWPVVVRCDVRADSGLHDLSLRTSDPLTDVTGLLDFMDSVSDEFEADGLDPADWAFLPAHLVPARVSVMVHARPGAQRVRLDALWGFPDGLGLLPHDTWTHDVAEDRLRERRRYKGSCLFYDERGWHFAAVPEPFDWASLLNDDEVRTASSWARRLADHLQREIQLMLLARIDGRRGAANMIPWHYTDHHVAPRGGAVRFLPPARIRTIATPEDLAKDHLEEVVGLYFTPEVDARRDASFVTEVGRAATALGVPVYFEGSVLGHPYYLLRSAGATVVAVGQDDPEPSEIEFNKLVRDEIPEIARRGGSAIRVIRADAAQAPLLLRHKLVEEALEVWDSDESTLLDELADIAELMAAFVQYTPITAEAIEAARLSKRAARGGFDRLTYLERTGSGPPPDRDTGPRGIPLFDSQEASDRAPVVPTRVSPVQVERSGDNAIVLRLPIAPPLRHGVALREYRLGIGDAEVVVTYRKATLEISIDARKQSPVAGQLSLPIEPA